MTTTNQIPQSLRYIDLGVGRMTCDDCTVTVAQALKSVPGVKTTEVSLESRSAHVTVDASVDPEQLAAAVRGSGYNAFIRGSGISE